MVFENLCLNEVNRAATTVDGVAGKSINVAKVLHALGGQACAIGFLGGDRGDLVRSVLRERGIGHEFVSVPVRTRQCVTVIDRAQGTVTELVD
jgi:fructose-1-phosphate kinase PfkB-like protein